MEALEIVKDILTDKSISQIKRRVRPGPKGYKLLLKLRLLLYAHLNGYFSTRKLRKHLKKRPEMLKSLGFQALPDKRTIDRWKKKLDNELQQFVRLTGDRYLQRKLSEWTILDSTPLVDEFDIEAKVGHNSQGTFKGFKLHMSCDEYEVPLRAVVTTANVHDSAKAEELLAPTKRTGGDSGYDAEKIKKAVKNIGSKPIFVHKRKTPKILKAARVVIEQCNGFIKSEVVQHAWTIVKGLTAKAVFALTAVLAIQALALFNLKRYGYPSIRIQEVRV
jgi:IS5 family transposase